MPVGLPGFVTMMARVRSLMARLELLTARRRSSPPPDRVGMGRMEAPVVGDERIIVGIETAPGMMISSPLSRMQFAVDLERLAAAGGGQDIAVLKLHA